MSHPSRLLLALLFVATAASGQDMPPPADATSPANAPLPSAPPADVPPKRDEPAPPGSVVLQGEFRAPGTYAITRDETLSHLIERAGGLTAAAYPYGAVFTRGAQGRIVVEADPVVLEAHPERDIAVRPGDSITVPPRTLTVIVSGEVQHPATLDFVSGADASAYVARAGGYAASADKGRAYVLLPNGATQPLQLSFWNFTPSRIPPGSTIVVPCESGAHCRPQP